MPPMAWYTGRPSRIKSVKAVVGNFRPANSLAFVKASDGKTLTRVASIRSIFPPSTALGHAYRSPLEAQAKTGIATISPSQMCSL